MGKLFEEPHETDTITTEVKNAKEKNVGWIKEKGTSEMYFVMKSASIIKMDPMFYLGTA